MANWVLLFQATARRGIAARGIRSSLTIAMIVIFFVYGLVYLASVLGILSPRNELIFILTANFATKLLFIIAFAGIRASQFNDLMVTLVRRKVLPIRDLTPNDLEALDDNEGNMPLID
mmetsp:Transcript_14756/g.41780  ORF Transcript_14756/g.41780 Transcript_14756/m.41780 type:complete len:118 (-) Transcript_14756:143-496(-)